MREPVGVADVKLSLPSVTGDAAPAKTDGAGATGSRLDPERRSTVGMLRVAGMAERWRHKAQKDALNHGGVWLNACIALTLNILTWFGLQVFVLYFAKDEQKQPFDVALYMIGFNVGINVMKTLCTKFMKQADTGRLGSVSTWWDRNHLTNMVIFAFELYRSIFKVSLFAEVGSLKNFVSFVLVDIVSQCINTILPMWTFYHEFMKSRGLTRGMVRDHVLDHRGFVCWKAFCQHTADVIATVQFLFLTCFLRFFYNKHFFPMYSLKCPEKFAQLMWYVPLSLAVNTVNYHVFGKVAFALYEITPTFVGSCMFKEHETLKRSFIIFAAHVISDVYYALVLQAMVPKLQGEPYAQLNHTVPACMRNHIDCERVNCSVIFGAHNSSSYSG